MLVMIVALAAGIAVLVVAFFVLAGRSRGRIIDPAFTSLGLTGRRYLLSGRQYGGSIGARDVNAYVRPTRRHGYGVLGTEVVKKVRYTGDTVELFVQASLKTRLDMVNGRMLGRDAPHKTSREIEAKGAGALTTALRARSKHQDVPHTAAGLRTFTIRGLDPQWGTRLVEAPGVDGVVRDLIGDETQVGLTSLHVQPEAVYFRTRVSRDDLTPDRVGRWFRDLVTFADVAQAMPGPGTPVAETKLEFLNRANRDAFNKYGYMFGGGLLGLVVGLALLVVWLVD